MEQKAQWLIDNQLLLQTLIGDQDITKHRTLTKQTYDLIISSPHKIVHIIADIRRVTYGLPIQDSMRVAREFHTKDRLGYVVTIGQVDLLVKLGTSIVKNFVNYELHNTKTMTQALDYLKEKEPDLNWDQINQELVTE